MQTAVRLSQGGTRGGYGGDVRLSHVFDSNSLKQIYFENFGDRVLAENKNITTLLWKDSMRITNYMLKSGINPGEIANKVPGIKFLVPIRNPIDCAVSNIKTGHDRHLIPQNDINEETVIYRILDLLRWFDDQSRIAPDSFFFFTEREMNNETAKKMCQFIGIEYRNYWGNSILDNLNIRSGYSHNRMVKASYKEMIKNIFSVKNPIREKLLELEEGE